MVVRPEFRLGVRNDSLAADEVGFLSVDRPRLVPIEKNEIKDYVVKDLDKVQAILVKLEEDCYAILG